MAVPQNALAWCKKLGRKGNKVRIRRRGPVRQPVLRNGHNRSLQVRDVMKKLSHLIKLPKICTNRELSGSFDKTLFLPVDIGKKVCYDVFC